MCCFSRPVIRVSQTNIFARSSEHGRHKVAYRMNLDTREDLAMILPIPVAHGSGTASKGDRQIPVALSALRTNVQCAYFFL